MTTLSDRLKALRAWKNLKQEDLADKLNVSRVTVSKIETSSNVSDELATAISELFLCNRQWLLTGKGEAPEGVFIKPKPETSIPWRDEAYEVMKRENQRLWLLVEKLSGAPVGSFLELLSEVHEPKSIPMYEAGAYLGGRAACA